MKPGVSFNAFLKYNVTYLSSKNDNKESTYFEIGLNIIERLNLKLN